MENGLTTPGRDQRTGGATLEQVAKVAGVSRATVSRVVNGSPRVSGDVRRGRRGRVVELGLRPQPGRPEPRDPPQRLDRRRHRRTERPRVLGPVLPAAPPRDQRVALRARPPAGPPHAVVRERDAPGGRLPRRRPRRRRPPRQPPRRRPPPRQDRRGGHPDGGLAATAAADVGQLRRRRQPGRRQQRGRPSRRPGPAGHRHGRRPVRHGPWRRPARGLPRCPARRGPPGRPGARSGRGLHPGRRHEGHGAPALRARISTPCSPPQT